jgi:hypothetical protein
MFARTARCKEVRLGRSLAVFIVGFLVRRVRAVRMTVQSSDFGSTSPWKSLQPATCTAELA